MANAQFSDLASIREALLKTVERNRIPITFKGVALELIQPTVGEIEEMRKDSTEGNNDLDGFVRILIRFSVLPGTDIHPLTPEDAPTIRLMPWSKEVLNVVESFGKLSNLDVAAEVKNSEETAS